MIAGLVVTIWILSLTAAFLLGRGQLWDKVLEVRMLVDDVARSCPILPRRAW